MIWEGEVTGEDRRMFTLCCAVLGCPPYPPSAMEDPVS
jgi:hypothetical protein